MRAAFLATLLIGLWAFPPAALSQAAFPPARAEAPVTTTQISQAPLAPVPAAPIVDHGAGASAASPRLTAAEAQSVLEILNDPAKRAAFSTTLQAMVRAIDVVPAGTATKAPVPTHAPLAATAPVAAKPAAAAAPTVPLAPNSLGAQLIARSSTWVSELSGQVSAFNHVLGNLPAVWAFTRRTFENPESRAQVLAAAWHLGLILLVAAIVEWAFGRALKRPIGALARSAPGGGSNVPHAATMLAAPPLAVDDPELDAAPVPDGPAEAQTVLRERRFGRTLRVLKRLPFMLMRLLLDLLPVATFLGLSYAGMAFVLPESQAVLWVAITAYVACRLAVVLAHAVVSPAYPSLRMVHLNDRGAAYVVVWVRRLVLVAALGFSASAIGVEFGLPLAARDAFLKAVFLIDHIFLLIIVLQCRRPVAAHIRGHGELHGLGGRVRARIASIWHLVAIFFIVALWLVWAAQVRHGYDRMWRIFAVSAGVLIAARVVSLLVLGALDRAFRISPATADRYPGLEARANRYYPLLRMTLSSVLVLLTGLALLEAWGMNVLSWFRGNALGGQLFSAAGTILIAGAVALAVWEATNASMERHLARLTKEAQIVRSARLRTLQPILRTLLLITLIAIFGLTALSEVGVNIAPLLAGAGILGVAIGFGSQKLVQDFITGIFLLLENTMQVGDAVTVAGLSGSVEHLSIRTMRLRAGDGSVHVIPFSSVTTVTNVNRGIGNAAVSVNVPIEEDSDHVCDVLSDIACQMRAEPRFADMMRSDLQLWGVDRVDAGVVTIVGQIVCTDGGRWAVQREFNRRLNIRFKSDGIRIATPTQTVFYHEVPAAPPKVAAVEDGAPPANTVRESPPPSALGNTS